MNNNPRHPHHPRPGRSRAGVTLVELLVATAILGVGSLLMVSGFSAVSFLTAKNLSLNDSNNNLRAAVNRIGATLQQAVEISDVVNFDPVAQTFAAGSAVAGSAQSGNAVRFVRLLPGTFYLLETGTGYSLANPPPGNVPIQLTVNVGAGPVAVGVNLSLGHPGNAPVAVDRPTYYPVGTTSLPVQVSNLPGGFRLTGSERLFVQYPVWREVLRDSPNRDVLQSDPLGAGRGLLGLGLQATSLAAGGTQATFQLVNPLTVNAQSQDPNATVAAFNAAYLVVESAFVVVPRADGYELDYMPDTRQPGQRTVVTTSVDAAGAMTDPFNQVAFRLPGSVGQCFVLGRDAGGAQYVRTLLPVRAKDYANAIRLVGGAAAANNAYVGVVTKLKSQQCFNLQ